MIRETMTFQVEFGLIILLLFYRICTRYTPSYASTFVTHDCELHAGFFQHPQAFSFTAVLHVTEVKAGDEDPEAKVGRPAEELGQSVRAVGTGRPGAEPGDGVAEPLLSGTSAPPQTRAQGSQVAQEEQLWRNRRK